MLRTVQIREEPIELYKILKLANLAQSGGEAKLLIEEGLVRVNSTVETRKRKKILAGDIIACAGHQIQIILG